MTLIKCLESITCEKTVALFLKNLDTHSLMSTMELIEYFQPTTKEQWVRIYNSLHTT